jgi:hypothetical protein
MKYSVAFVDLQGRVHVLYTDDQFTAHVTAGQMSIQFDQAEIRVGKEVFIFKFGAMQV